MTKKGTPVCSCYFLKGSVQRRAGCILTACHVNFCLLDENLPAIGRSHNAQFLDISWIILKSTATLYDEMHAHPCRISWDLPHELMDIIMCQLTQDEDRHTMRLVCRCWRAAVNRTVSRCMKLEPLPWLAESNLRAVHEGLGLSAVSAILSSVC